MKFTEPRTAAQLKTLHKPYFSKDRYYSFAETKRYWHYDPPPGYKILIHMLNGFFRLLSFFIPLSLYFLLLFAYIKKVLDAPGTQPGATLNVPIVAMGTLPLFIYMMFVLYTFSELLMLNLNFSKWYVLKNYTLVWGGIRKSVFLEDHDKKRLIKLSIITGAIFVITIIVSFIMPAVF